MLARSLAVGIGAVPGAVMLSSDLERKAGLAPGAHLAPDRYLPKGRQAIYRGIFYRAAAILGAGHSAVLDATFLDPALRAKAASVAKAAGASFCGLWLDAPTELLEARISARHDDPSDADITVLHRQMDLPQGTIHWHRIDASAGPDQVAAQARHLIACGCPADGQMPCTVA